MKLFGVCSLLCLVHLSVTQLVATENVILDRVISNDFETGSNSPFSGTAWNIQSSKKIQRFLNLHLGTLSATIVRYHPQQSKVFKQEPALCYLNKFYLNQLKSAVELCLILQRWLLQTTQTIIQITQLVPGTLSHQIKELRCILRRFSPKKNTITSRLIEI